MAHIKDLTGVNSEGSIRAYTKDDYFGNLMHQSQDLNSQELQVAGTKIESFQINEIYRLYKIPALNRGLQGK